MKYKLEIDINRPRETVVALFDDPKQMHAWQPDLVSFEHIKGEPGTVGAQSELVYQMGRREVKMIETITERNLPDEFSGTYETEGVWNSVSNHFLDLGPQHTRWKFDTEFRCTGVIKIMAMFMPGSFKKRSWQFMRQFKDFAEKQA